MNKNISKIGQEFIKQTLDREPKVELLIGSFAKSFKEQVKDEVSDETMKGIYNMVLFLVCSIVDLKNKESEHELEKI